MSNGARNHIATISQNHVCGFKTNSDTVTARLLLVASDIPLPLQTTPAGSQFYICKQHELYLFINN